MIIPTAGGSFTGGSGNGSNDWVYVNFTNGVGTVTLNAPQSNPNTGETITSSELTSGSNGSGTAESPISYNDTTISYANPTESSISLTPTLPDVSNNTPTEDAVSVAINDQAGQQLTSGAAPYVTFTITGPGSFDNGGTPVTTLSEYVSPTSDFTLPVYSVDGQSGTIQVSASAAGLTSKPITIQSEETTPASQFALTSQTETLSSSFTVDGKTLPKGTQYTVYTVQVEDQSGAAVAAQDNLTLSDSTTANGGTEALYYYNYSAANGPGTPITNGALQTSASTGQAQFAVFNASALTSPATITVTDTTLNTKETATYNFQVGSATQAQFTNQESAQNVEAGKTVTYSVQLQDAAGNNVSEANQPVNFYFDGNQAGATINGGDYWLSTNPYVVYTNAQGVASVTVSVPNTASAGNTFTLDASYDSQTTAASETNTVVNPGSYATAIGLNSATVTGGVGNYPTAADNVSLPSSMTSGQTLTQALGLANGTSIYAYPLNSIGEYANSSDTLQISTSNSNVLSITGATNGAETFNAGAALPTVTAEQSGSATLTITDLSNPSAPVLTQTINVTGGTTPTQISTLNPSGELNTAYTFTSSGVVGPFTIETTDAGGNLVPNSAPVGLTAAEVEAAIGVSGVTGIRTSASGADVPYVTIGANQGSIQVWVDGATSGNATSPTTLALNTLDPALESASGSGSTVSLTFDSAIQSAVQSDFGVSGDTVTGDSINGQTVTLTLGSALPVGATVSLMAGAVTTGYGASNVAISNQAISGAPSSTGVSASGTTTTPYAAATSATASTDTITYGSPAAGATVDVNGTTYTAEAAGSTLAADQFDSESTLVSAINANTNSTNISATSSGSTVTLSDSTGSNSATLSSSDSTNLAVGSATFSGGTAATAATPSVYTLTVSSGATATGNLTVTVMSGATTVATVTPVAVSAGDTAAQVAAAIANALQSDANVTGTFTVNYTAGATSLTLTQNTASSAATSVSVSG
ncbi:beta strand repeat-containing protein [Sulfobacillus harzensis]|uniref:Uncharacterized protein n=1 Tax=Sulfobacillus harzensis TaxID=2729629 RepID=A0A7Y0Q2T9_9FIRM|nr:hypothetical protein [Sulfobacillus harzensis]NMP22892.1 hypothetical protein [Sulfobacillus harzensis]